MEGEKKYMYDGKFEGNILAVLHKQVLEKQLLFKKLL